MNDLPSIELTDHSTGETYTERDLIRLMRVIEPAKIYAEMRRRVNLAILPHSLFFAGSEFRQFVADFAAKHGEPPRVFSIGDGPEMPLPQHWPEDPIFSVPRRNFYREYTQRKPEANFPVDVSWWPEIAAEQDAIAASMGMEDHRSQAEKSPKSGACE